MTTYDTYKDSGERFAGKVPANWNRYRIKFLLTRSTSGVWGKDEKGDDNDIICFRIADFDYAHGGLKYGNLTLRNIKQAERKGRLLSTGDLLIEKSGGGVATPVGRVVRYMFDKQAVCSNFIHFISLKTDFSSNFLYYYFFSLYANKENLLYFNQTTGIQNLKIGEYLGQSIFLPQLKEQNLVATWLDSKCAKIDEAIAQQQKMIDLLKERKQIIINEAVTHGLDPNVPMKQTGIDWLPQIPAHWLIRRMASLGTFSKGSGISRDDLTEEGLPAILYGDIYTKYEISVSNLLNHISEKTAANAVKINAGDILLTGSGETKEDIGKAILYNGELAYAGGDVIIFRQQRNDALFLSYVLNSFYARYYKAAMSKGEIVVHTYPYMLKNLVVPIPPIKEQSAIAVYLEEKIQTINVAIQRHERMISLLTERKQIVINDVVTGKIKVI